ncbi:C2H2 type zinc finger domain-containing protein, partial [Corynespora cassiicola Philippines]
LFLPSRASSLHACLSQPQDKELAWRAWAKTESVKRMIVCLVMIDSFFASNSAGQPVIRIDALQFHIPCSRELFNAPTGHHWAQLASAGAITISPVLDLRIYPTILPSLVTQSDIEIHGLKATIWLQIAALKHRFLNRGIHEGSLEYIDLFPGDQYCRDSTGAMLVPLVCDIYSKYKYELETGNPNCLALWHTIGIGLTANMDLFELAAGRDGVEAAKLSIAKISQWAQSPTARRVCLHAAQTYTCMSRRTILDGTMFNSEIALFNSDLVLGFYLYAAPEHLEGGSGASSPLPLELLEDIDWSQVGMEGLPGIDTCPEYATSAARHFIKEGGRVSFSGFKHSGGYGLSKRVVLEFVGLLEEVGRWNVREFCHILRIMSDGMIELENPVSPP